MIYRKPIETIFTLDYEREFGHPETREERDATKEVYERYRAIKRLARRSSQVDERYH